ncbi:hypothetical protein TcasGA2_TC001614 [Tribolium castaneum]|uniref:Uncharacterized protein n=1 Tax=Tribolium castaneum TaxID=7070 RepID=D6W6J5_TRICA|nr:hypothetical protein TcasGA2_TC001614 [Tribolium castaneum]
MALINRGITGSPNVDRSNADIVALLADLVMRVQPDPHSRGYVQLGAILTPESRPGRVVAYVEDKGPNFVYNKVMFTKQ